MKKTYHFEIEIDVKPFNPESESMPDCTGLWVDCEGDVWLVNDDLTATAIRIDGIWMNPSEPEYWVTTNRYDRYAPFTRVVGVTTYKEEA